jgi:hypothetical protein
MIRAFLPRSAIRPARLAQAVAGFRSTHLCRGRAIR